MVQYKFLDLTSRFQEISEEVDPLDMLNKVINWEHFRKPIVKLISRKNKDSSGGRPAYDYTLIFKIIILQTLYTMSD